MRILLVLCLFVSLLSPLYTFAQPEEKIVSFSADIEIQPDSKLLITETIVYDFGSTPSRGIFRDVYGEHAQAATSDNKRRITTFELLSVRRGGMLEEYWEYSSADLGVRIGNPDRTITGEHTYTIVYEVSGAFSALPDNTSELYWDVTGASWQVPMEEVIVRIYGTGLQEDGAIACYVGYFQETTTCAESAIESGVVVFSEQDLIPGQEVTIAVATPSITSPEILEAYTGLFIFKIIVVGIAVLLLTLLLYIYLWKTWHKPRHTTELVQYSPYLELPPTQVGLLVDGEVHPSDITAGLIELAQKGYLKITHVKRKTLIFLNDDDYEVELLKDPDSITDEYQAEILKLLYRDNERLVGKVVSIADIAKSTSKRSSNARIVSQLKRSGKKYMTEEGYLESSKRNHLFTFLRNAFFIGIFISFPLAILIDFLTDSAAGFFLTPICLLGAVFFGVIGSLRRRTKKGYEARNHILGFKDFLTKTDKERFTFHNAPKRNAETYMQYLPYAVALGVEEEWSEAFEDVTIEMPDWYSDTTGAFTTFSAANLGGNIATLSTAFTRSTRPVSTSSSGSSSRGSSGGGFSGGGGGGGGGGSW